MSTVFPALIGDEYSTGIEQSASVPYRLAGFPEYLDAHAAALAEIPDKVLLPNGNRIERNNIRLRRETDVDWLATIGYGIREDEGIDSFSIDFDVAAQTTKITQSIETLRTYTLPGFTAVDYQGALGATKDGVEGIDIVTPTLSWSERFTLPDSAVDENYIAGLMSIVGRTNNAQFGMFGVGTVLQAGMTGSKKGAERWDLAAKFMASPDIEGATVGGITGINKGGWEYLEVHYVQAANETAARMYQKPVQVIISRVYYSAAFSGLKIPGKG